MNADLETGLASLQKLVSPFAPRTGVALTTVRGANGDYLCDTYF